MKSKFRSSVFIIFVVMLSLLLGGNYYLKTNSFKANQKEYIDNLNSSEHFITSDQLADRIINDDPSLQIIDLRNTDEFKKYHIPNAINVAMDSILNYLSDETELLQTVNVVLVSNDSFNSELIYSLTDDKSNIEVLKGGMQSWYNTVINPEKPDANSDITTLNNYASRKGASMYFGVKYPQEVEVKPVIKKVVTPKKVTPVKKKKKLPIEGGC